jgi:hypothetical protein
MTGIVAVALVVSTVSPPRVVADENGEVHYWSSGSSYVPSDEGRVMNVSDEHPVEYVDADDAMPMVTGTPLPASAGHVYIVNDDPGYDLSGPNDHWFLLGDGTAFRDDNWRGTAALASTGGMRHDVVPITAEYRQDWLAVAAGDRPVRTFTAPRSSSNMGVMAVAPMEYESTPATNNEAQMSSTQYRDTFRPVHHPRRRAYRQTRAVRYTSTQHYTNADFQPAVSQQAAVETSEATVQVAQDRMGNELYQINNSFYFKDDNNQWYRAESWRGPFARLGKGKVPREVRMSAKHPSRMDMDLN